MFQNRKRAIKWALTLALLIALALTSFASAYVTTDQRDYSPGDIVTISGDNRDGAGYQASETVQVDVSGPNGYAQSCTGVVNENGAWSCQVTLFTDNMAVGSYFYTAKGLISGVSQSGTFTDGNATVTGIVKDSTNNPVAGAIVSCTTSSGCNDNFSVTTNSSGQYFFDSGTDAGHGLKLTFSGTSGSLTLTATKPGYKSGTIAVSVLNGKIYNNEDITISIIDSTAPTAVPTQSPAANANGWNNSDVAVNWNWSDNAGGSGIDTANCTTSSTSSGEGTITLNASCKDLAGNTGNASYTVKVDKTAPEIAFVGPTTSAWYKTDVTANWNCSDTGSGVVSASVNATASGEGSAIPATGTCTDKAGNTASDTQNFKIDKTAPTVTITPDHSANANGWYNSTVKFTVSGNDTLSDGVTCSSIPDYSGPDNGSASVSASCTDAAGNTGNATFNFKYDVTKPTITAAATTTPDGLNGWYVSDVTVYFTCSDATSGIPDGACPVDQTLSAEGAAVSSTTQTVTDAAGNASNLSNVVTVKIDKTAPTNVKLTATGTAGTNGWFTSDVAVTTSGEDAISGVTCTPDQNQTTETTGTDFNGSCTNGAGLKTDAAPLTVKMDKTAPTGVSGSPSRVPDHNGWYNHAVDVVFTGTDGTSGIDSCTTITYSTPDGTGLTVNGSCTDKAGNTSASVTSSAFDFDATKPILSPSVSPIPVVLNGPATANPNASDALSGIDTASCGAVDTSSVGTHSVNCIATDKAGNTNTATATYSVLYATGGICYGGPGHQILQPINADGSSVFKKGSTVPAKFRVCDANGNSIGTPGVVVSFQPAKITDGTVTGIDEAVDSTTPDTAFRWSSSDQQWIFNINTKSLSAPKTYIFLIKLNDGSTIQFQFGLR